MLDFKKILVPTDFSDNASVAYHPAYQIAKRYNAKIDLMHVIPTMRYFSESMKGLGVPLSMEKDLYPKAHQEATQHLKKIMNENIKEENQGEVVVEIAPKPSRAIAEHAEQEGYDLIVIAAKGSHESELLKGSITEKVIRYSKVPVLTTDQSNLDVVDHILLPTDGSSLSLKALPMAVSAALTFDADITLYYVQELYDSMTDEAWSNTNKSDETNEDDSLKDILLNKLEDFFFSDSWDRLELRRGDDGAHQLVYYDGASNATINLSVVVERRVSAHYAITEYAEEHADMVVMATHGRSGLAHVFLGSTTEKVAQHLDLPVITVKPDFDEEKRR